MSTFQKKREAGITLVALIITIIVLIILAAVTIISVTESELVDRTIRATAEYAKAQESENTEIDALDKRMSSLTSEINSIIGETGTGDENGGDPTDDPKEGTVAYAVKNDTTFTENTKLVDKYGNVLTVPKGFKIVPNGQDEVVYKYPDNPTVQDGIVIQDVSAGGEGNQFVWIPVGTLKNGNEESVSNTSITLERRVFNNADSTGKCTVQEHKADETAIDTYYIEQTHEDQEQPEKNYENAIAKNIEEFKTGVSNNGGYYLARFEASDSKTGLAKSVMEASPWVNILQEDASARSQAMYEDDEQGSKGYQSDLANSYAWDTAIYFIQECSKEKAYAMKKGREINSSLAKTGANSDKPCNICDMAGNAREWSTETSTFSGSPCVGRGGNYGYSDLCTSHRSFSSTDDTSTYVGFRPILYVK